MPHDVEFYYSFSPCIFELGKSIDFITCDLYMCLRNVSVIWKILEIYSGTETQQFSYFINIKYGKQATKRDFS